MVRAATMASRTARIMRHPNVYGQTKLEGELAIKPNTGEIFYCSHCMEYLVVNGKNFIKTIYRCGKNTRYSSGCPNDQIGTPRPTYDLARLLVDIVKRINIRYYHATNEGELSAGTILQKKSIVRLVIRQKSYR